MDSYYNIIADSYNELYEEEQREKISLALKDITIKKEYSLLDIGCGTGFYLDDFSCEVIGIDPSEKMIEKYKGKNKIMHCYAEELPFQFQEFEIVTSFTAIQNFKNIKKGLEEIKRVGKNIFILTFLKRGDNSDKILETIKKIFYEFNIKEIEHHKDIILILTK